MNAAEWGTVAQWAAIAGSIGLGLYNLYVSGWRAKRDRLRSVAIRAVDELIELCEKVHLTTIENITTRDENALVRTSREVQVNLSRADHLLECLYSLCPKAGLRDKVDPSYKDWFKATMADPFPRLQTERVVNANGIEVYVRDKASTQLLFLLKQTRDELNKDKLRFW